MNNRPVADAALQNFQRVSFAGGVRQNDLFISFYFFAYLPQSRLQKYDEN
jgi:prolyl-tRNA editing enzyme YbaK/EbsC (Cys-tRNA(Pro) deacylase)